MRRRWRRARRLLPQWWLELGCEVLGHEGIPYVGRWRWCLRCDDLIGPTR